MKMSQLQRWAHDERMIPDASVQASSTIVIDAPITRVWDVATNVSKWARWYEYLRNAEVQGAFAAGTKLSYGGLIRHDLSIAKVHDRELVMICGKLLIYSAITRWDFEELSTDRTSVRFSESSEGFLIGVLYGSEKLAQHLERWLDKLKVEAERR